MTAKKQQTVKPLSVWEAAAYSLGLLGREFSNNNEETWKLVSSQEQYRGKAEFVQENLISENSLTILRIFMFLMPIPLCIIAFIVYKKKYCLYGKTYDDIKAEIDRRRLESGLTAESDASETIRS